MKEPMMDSTYKKENQMKYQHGILKKYTTPFEDDCFSIQWVLPKT